ncbi:hypothetical protein D9M71_264210 [compost metagenome]
MGKGLQGHHHQQEDQGQADQQDVQGDFVGRFLPFGAFNQGDHTVQGRLAGVGGDFHQQPVGHHSGVAGHRRTVATRLTDYRRGLAGDRRLVDGRNAFDYFTVAGDHFTGHHAHDVALAQAARCHLLVVARSLAPLRTETLATGFEAVGARLATTFGQGFGEVGEQHGKPQPHGYLHGDCGRHQRVWHQAQHSGQHGRQLHHQHHRRTLELTRVELDESLYQGWAPQGGN